MRHGGLRAPRPRAARAGRGRIGEPDPVVRVDDPDRLCGRLQHGAKEVLGIDEQASQIGQGIRHVDPLTVESTTGPVARQQALTDVPLPKEQQVARARDRARHADRRRPAGCRWAEVRAAPARTCSGVRAARRRPRRPRHCLVLLDGTAADTDRAYHAAAGDQGNPAGESLRRPRSRPVGSRAAIQLPRPQCEPFRRRGGTRRTGDEPRRDGNRYMWLCDHPTRSP